MHKGPISEIAKINPALPLSAENNEFVSFVGMADVSDRGGIIRTDSIRFGNFTNGYSHFVENDVLFAKITPCMENGKGALARCLRNGIGFGSTEFHVLRAKSNGCAGFIYQVCQSPEFRLKAESFMTGSAGQRRVPADFFRKYRIYLPDRSVQQAIAEILSSIDAIIETNESLITKHQQIKAGMMHDLFTRGVDAHGHLRPSREQAPELYKLSLVGWIPKEWEAVQLGNILRDWGGHLQTGPFGSQLHAHEYTIDGIPVVMPQNIENGRVVEDSIARISQTRAQQLIRHRLCEGDIIIARRGELERAAAIVHEQTGWVCGTGCFILRLGGSGLDPKYFSFAYRHDTVQRQVAANAVGTTMLSLNNTIMESLFFPLIEYDEQKEISQRLSTIDDRIEVCQTEAAKLQKIKKWPHARSFNRPRSHQSC